MKKSLFSRFERLSFGGGLFKVRVLALRPPAAPGPVFFPDRILMKSCFYLLVLIAFLRWTNGVGGSEQEFPELVGISLPKQRVSLGLPMEARLSRLRVEEGQTVEAGQELAILYSETEELERDRVAAVLKRAEFQYDSKLNLRAKNGQAISESEVVGAEVERDVARIDLKRYSSVLRDKTLVAPWRGRVLRVFKGVGETVNRGEKVVELVDLSSVYVDVYVEAALLGAIQAGQTAQISGEALRGKSLQAVVAMVDPVVDPGSGLSRVRLSAPNPQGEITTGLPVRVRFLLGEKTARNEARKNP
jgi:membrane fusion protein, multidrug efflux system